MRASLPTDLSCELPRSPLLLKVCIATFVATGALAANTCDVPPRCSCREDQFQVDPLVASCVGRTCSADVELIKLQSQRMVTLPTGVANVSVQLTAPLVDLDLKLQDGVTGACVAGAFCALSGGSYSTIQGCLVKGGQEDCIKYQNMTWYFSGDDGTPPILEELRSIGSTNKRMDIMVQAARAGIGTVTLSNAPIADCPAVLPGCKPCSEYQGCAQGLEFPRCTGCSRVECVPITHTTTSATVTSVTSTSRTTSVTSISTTTLSTITVSSTFITTTETSSSSATSTSVTSTTSITTSTTHTDSSTVSTTATATQTLSSTSTISTYTRTTRTHSTTLSTVSTSTSVSTTTASGTSTESTSTTTTYTSSTTDSATATTMTSFTSSSTTSSVTSTFSLTTTKTSTFSLTTSTSVSSITSSTSSTSATTTVSMTSSTVSSMTTSTSVTQTVSSITSSTTASTSVTETTSSTTSISKTFTSQTYTFSTSTNSSTTVTTSTTSTSTKTTLTQTATSFTITTQTTWTTSQTTNTTSTSTATVSSTTATRTATNTTTATRTTSATTMTSSSISTSLTITTSASSTKTTTLTSTSLSTTTTSTCGCCNFCAAPICSNFQAYCDASRSEAALVPQMGSGAEVEKTATSDASIALFVISLVLLFLEACVALWLCMQWKNRSDHAKSDLVEQMDSILPVAESELQHLVDQQKQQIEMLQRQLAKLQQKLDQANQVVDAEQRSRKNFQQRNLELTHENSALADARNVLEQLRIDLEAKLRKSNAERQGLQGSLMESQHTLQELRAGMLPRAGGGDLQERLEASENLQRSLEEQLQEHKQRLQQSENERQTLGNRLEQYKAAIVGKTVPPSAYVEDSLHSQQQYIDNMQLMLQRLQHGDFEQQVSRTLAQSLHREIAATYEHIQHIVHSRDEPKPADALQHPGSVVHAPRGAPFPSEPVLAAPPPPTPPQPPPAYPPMRLG
eukprot:TRINITY_DN87288_c0_g1_i1.p1 TRINITY_DN87288_c0_g1~~TRINITY_DN87288_c0_g1_i1.p1  ORF type:complete len:967 (-),score=150.49 TRINITY_DN87288_c0_g1_i1:97-2997(-)